MDADEADGWFAALERLTNGWHPGWVILLVVLCLIVLKADKIITAWRSESNQKMTSTFKHQQVMTRLTNQKVKPAQTKKGP